MKKIYTLLLMVAFACFAAGISLWLDLLQYAGMPAQRGAETVMFSVNTGESLKRISQQLELQGIIRHPGKFSWYARMKGYDKRIKAGAYELSSALTPRQILEAMVQGRVALDKITIPEGYNLSQIASLLARNGIAAETDFMRRASDASLARARGIEAETFEGYLFPETYYFPKGVSAETIIDTMVRRLNAVYVPEWDRRAEALKMSRHQVLTLASIIEKETGAAFERPLISSVFHNRLQKGMRLSSDPTVIYGIEDFDGNLTRKHLATWTPYNTYLIKGLPPGPIANPGIDSIRAALYPADTDYLYFVSKKDSTHQFSTNFKAHDRAVRKYQLKR